MEVLKLPDNFDIYVGPILSTKTMSLQTGVRFNFGEVFGVYGAAQYNFFETITIGSNLGLLVAATLPPNKTLRRCLPR